VCVCVCVCARARARVCACWWVGVVVGVGVGGCILCVYIRSLPGFGVNLFPLRASLPPFRCVCVRARACVRA
jgi:hypothetical protein